MDEPPGNRALIEVHVTDLKQLFRSLDPTPFRERDLDPRLSKSLPLSLDRSVNRLHLQRADEVN